MASPISYKRFRTGLTYREVAAMVWSYDEDPRTWLNGSTKTTKKPDGKKKWNRRRLILGKWFEIKQEMYREYMAGFNQADQGEHIFDQIEKLDDLDPVPF